MHEVAAALGTLDAHARVHVPGALNLIEHLRRTAVLSGVQEYQAPITEPANPLSAAMNALDTLEEWARVHGAVPTVLELRRRLIESAAGSANRSSS